QAENFVPSAVPTFIASRNRPRGPPGPPNVPPDPESLCVVVVAVVPVAEPARFATPGERPPPPQPAARSAKAATPATDARTSERRQRMFSAPSHTTGVYCAEEIDPIRLPRGNRSCYLRVTGTAACLKPAEGG